MRRMVLLATGVLLGMLLAMLYLSTMAVADGGPHNGFSFTTTTDACAGCHRVHTAPANKLLKEANQLTLCYTCHGSSGTGAYNNVEDGVFDTTSRSGDFTQDNTGSVEDAGLRGGGFSNALMDTDVDGAPTSAATTSSHSVDGSNQTAWGGGTTGNGTANIPLVCGSCHNPHGNGNYRILRGYPNDGYAETNTTGEVNLADEFLWGSAQTGAGIVINNGPNSIDKAFDSDYADASFDQANDSWTFDSVDNPPSWVDTAYRLEARFYISGWTDDVIDLDVQDGTSWTNVDTFDGTNPPPSTATNKVYDVSAILNTNAKVTGAQIRLVLTTVTGTADNFTLYIDGVRLSYKNYTISYEDGTGSYPANYRDSSYAPTNAEDWCAQCHTRQLHTNTAGAPFTNRHNTDGLAGACFRCHVAHGTSASMTTTAGEATFTGGPTGSRLLHVDNRGVCIQCHGPGGSQDITTD